MCIGFSKGKSAVAPAACQRALVMLELTIAQAKAQRIPALGLYVHVPFCAKTCDYCAFYQTKPTADLVHQFLAGVEREAELPDWTRPVDTVFWGGGTPGLLAPHDLETLGGITLRHA